MSEFSIDYQAKIDTLERELRILRAKARFDRGLSELIHAIIDNIPSGSERQLPLANQAEQGLVESQYSVTEIINSLPDATFVIDAQGKVLFWNRAIEKLTGVKAEDMVGKGDHEYAMPFYGERRPILIDIALQPREDLADKYAFVKQRGEYLVAEAHVRRQQGGETYVLGTASVLRDANGEIVGAIETISDLSEHKRMEEVLHQAKEQAEAATRAKSAFLATMSHEIRTPMNAIIGMTGLLLDTPLDVQQRDFAETIRNSGDALLTIVNDILDFSKIEAGQMELEKAPFSLRECVESALDLMGARAAEKRLDLGYLIEAHTPSDFYGDVTRLRQILLNLLGNAIKFTEKGEVVVSVSAKVAEETPNLREGEQTERSLAESYELHLAVRDTGIGIPKDRMNRLFQSFSQVDDSTTRKYGGTGLGLAISKRLAELMGGRIWVESEVGRGSTFHFTIVARTATSTRPVYMVGEQPSLQGKRVLVVDDNATGRTILELQTKSWGMVPVLAASGSEALHLIRGGEPFDLAILDMHMPEMDGLTLAEEIRRDRGAEVPPLIMLTSLGRQEADPRLDLFAAFLTKPVKAPQLYNTLMEVFAIGDDVRMHPEEEKESEFDATMGVRLPLRILLAEDNAVNQKLALLILERLGYRADVAANGLEVLDALGRQLYDVVLMDIQMPEMDGLQATRVLRERFPTAQPYVIAMTANAMQGDKEACLAAGMNDYVSKPIIVKDLVAALERVPGREAEAAAGLLDSVALEQLKRTLGSRAASMLPELIARFFSEAARMQTSARRALEQGKASELKRFVHTLKSNALLFGARRLGELCQTLEDRAGEGNLDEADTLLDEIAAEYAIAKPALEAMQEVSMATKAL